jgi:cyclopropane fatty-acyl-phospholipid synthase-like methyltransferase
VDRAEASRISHGQLRLWNPLSEAALDEVIGLLDLAPEASALDVACGRGEVLRRVAARWNVRGVGYDSDAALLEAAPGIG